MSGRFDPFLEAFLPSDERPTQTAPLPQNELISDVPEFMGLLNQLGGKSLNKGLYRLFDARLFNAAMSFVHDAFPAWSANVAPFGCDWMGRIYAVEGTERRGPDGERSALLLDPATRDLLQVPASVTALHNEILITEAEIALEESLWHSWSAKVGRALSYDEVAGWRVPAFLGGELVLENLDIQLAPVYWGLSGQLIAQTFKLKQETRISAVRIE